jgi:hypothetical protein
MAYEVTTQNEYDDVTLDNFDRTSLLPHLFKIKGKDFSLDKYPQMKALYARKFVPKTIYFCGRQVSKSTNLSRSEVFDAISIEQFQQLFIAPLQDQTLRYSRSVLQEAINTCRTAKLMQSKKFATKHGSGGIDITNNITNKSFSNGASIQLSYASTDPDRVRGITSDRIDFDEVQDQIFDNVNVIAECLANSEWGIQRFTGTAKTMDNPIQYLWEESSQGEWVIKCTSCNTHNFPTKDGNVLDMIQAQGPSCFKCGTLLNPRTGKWIHAYPDRVDKFVGYHIPQIVLPAMTESRKRWLSILNKVATLPESVLYMEVLGISTDQGTRLITQADIDRASSLGAPPEQKDQRHKYQTIVMGVDWGIANITSFTAIAICGITYNGNIECIHGDVWGGLDITEIFQRISALATEYQCEFVACDYGAGFHNNQILAIEYHLPVVQLFYVTQGTFLSYAEKMGIPLWKVDRNTALDIVFANIRKEKIRFLAPEYSKDYTSHLMAVIEEKTETSSGKETRKFDRIPDRPDDFLHALTFASMILYQATGHDVIQTVPEAKSGQNVESQEIDRKYGLANQG